MLVREDFPVFLQEPQSSLQLQVEAVLEHMEILQVVLDYLVDLGAVVELVILGDQPLEAMVFQGREIQEADLWLLLIPIQPVVEAVLEGLGDREAKEDQDPLAPFRDWRQYTPVVVAVIR